MSEPPSLPQKAATVATAAMRWVKGGFALSNEATVSARSEICKSCKNYDATGYGGLGGCLNCGCIIPTKVRLATEHCPIGKW